MFKASSASISEPANALPSATAIATRRGTVAPFAWAELMLPATKVAPITAFVRAAVRAGDRYVDADSHHPAADGAAVAATSTGAQTVLVFRDRSRALTALQIPPSLVHAARTSGAPAPVLVAGATPLDACAGNTLLKDGLVHINAGDASQVAPLLAGARGLVRAGQLGTVSWRVAGESARTRTAAATAMTALRRLGFSHFTLASGVQGDELVPVEEPATTSTIFSLSEHFLARANGSLPEASPNTADHAPRAESMTEDGGLAPASSVQTHATVLFDAVTEDLTPGARALGRVPSAGELAQLQLELAWPAARVVSFDIFDTLVVRATAAPVDVFLHLCAHEPFASVPLSAVALRTARELAENVARRTAYATHGSAEATLPEIHSQLARDLGLPQALVDDMVKAEQSVELALCSAHTTLKYWFERAQRDGKAIWCLSDTYHNAAFLKQILAHCGFLLDGVRVISSADKRCSKSEGRLFRDILPEMGVPTSSVLHIGDNATSDQEIPATMGICTVLHPWAACRHTDAPAQSAGDSAALGLAMIGARTGEPAPPFWWRFGYSVAGPLLAGFALWLHDRFVADGIDRAYFLLRDGEVLREVYHTVVGDTCEVSTALLESSRRAFTLPAYEADVPALRAQLTASENPRPAREFLDRLGVNAETFARVFIDAGFVSINEMVQPGDRSALRRVALVMRHEAIVNALRARSTEERALLLDYLDGEGVLDTGRVAIVDVGWNATIQKSLVASLSLAKRTHTVHGYYLGTSPKAHLDTGTSRTSGYLFESGYPLDRTRAVMALPQLVEIICTTTRGSLRQFARVDGRVVPVHGSMDHDATQVVRLQQLREGAMDYANTFAQRRGTSGMRIVSPDAALQRLARVIASPTAEEAHHIGDSAYGDGMGTDRSRRLAAFTPGKWSLESIHRDRLMSYWPAGLAARREPQALALRTANWLFECANE